MRNVVLIALAVFVLLLVGGGIMLASWNMSAPTAKIEKPVPDEKLAK